MSNIFFSLLLFYYLFNPSSLPIVRSPRYYVSGDNNNENSGGRDEEIDSLVAFIERIHEEIDQDIAAIEAEKEGTEVYGR